MQLATTIFESLSTHNGGLVVGEHGLQEVAGKLEVLPFTQLVDEIASLRSLARFLEQKGGARAARQVDSLATQGFQSLVRQRRASRRQSARRAGLWSRFADIDSGPMPRRWGEAPAQGAMPLHRFQVERMVREAHGGGAPAPSADDVGAAPRPPGDRPPDAPRPSRTSRRPIVVVDDTLVDRLAAQRGSKKP